MLTIFANLRINEPERLQHMKDSFESFKDISDDWVINIRGELSEEGMSFLKERLGDKMVAFDLVDDSRGWINNALEMLSKAKYDYVFLWNEDHMNIAPQEIYSGIVREMSEQKADYLITSWWMFGEVRKVFDDLREEMKMEKLNYVDIISMSSKKWKKAVKSGYRYYLISLCGIYNKDFLMKMMRRDNKKLPISLTKFLFKVMGFVNVIGIRFNTKKMFHNIDKLFFHRLRRYTNECPFDMEKASTRTDMLPIKIAFPKQELFACIDDDLDMPGYSLINRGLYKEKI